MNKIFLGSTVRITAHSDESLVGKYGRVTSVTAVSASVWIDDKTQATRQVPLENLEVVADA